MKALVLEEYNTPFALKEIDRPVPAVGQVLVQIKASGVNPLDTKIRAGQAGHAKQPVPAILGIDMAGTVVEVGEGITAFKPGDDVYGMTGGVGSLQGSLAQYAAVDAALLAIKPKNLTMREAAAIPLGFITAWEGLVDRANVREGQTVLVHGGAGGVGHLAIQIAQSFGADVYTTASAKDEAYINELGATFIDYGKESVEEYIAKHTDGEGFDIISDNVGGATLDASFKAIKLYTGHVVTALGWGTHSLAPLSFRGATYSGVFTLLPLLSGKNHKKHGDILREATKLAEAGKLKPRLDEREFTLENAMDAHTALEGRAVNGKLIVSIA